MAVEEKSLQKKDLKFCFNRTQFWLTQYLRINMVGEKRHLKSPNVLLFKKKTIPVIKKMCEPAQISKKFKYME